ncbi:MAG TPA: formate dehydrogenase accessory sulfurtransferase FdhD [Opitutaceae bacterium]|nr:formate dehydrogenase accessory sulfurtransferase FdhD [Opitutaceae bacterium]
MPPAHALRTEPITRIDGAAGERRDDVLAVEEPLEIRVAGRSLAVVMRTPGHDRELAAGFLVTEGLVRRRDDVLDMIYCGRGDATPSSRSERSGGAASPSLPRETVLDVLLAPGVAVDFARLSRNVFTSSSCGICSKASIDAVRTQFPPLGEALAPRRAVLAALPAKLRAAQAGFAATGGLHASGLFTRAGELVVAREDVGRHNALDKAIGHAFFGERLPLAAHILLVSGRVSFEIVQKALAAGIPCIAAISAPTSAAVELARESGQTLVGFLRGAGMNVYAGTLAD